MYHTKEQRENVYKEHAARFLNRESNRTSLITVTHADMSPDGRNVTIYFTVLPEEYEAQALDFTKRKRTEFKEYIVSALHPKRIPQFDFAIDEGEKNRQTIDRLSYEDNKSHT